MNTWLMLCSGAQKALFKLSLMFKGTPASNNWLLAAWKHFAKRLLEIWNWSGVKAISKIWWCPAVMLCLYLCIKTLYDHPATTVTKTNLSVFCLKQGKNTFRFVFVLCWKNMWSQCNMLIMSMSWWVNGWWRLSALNNIRAILSASLYLPLRLCVAVSFSPPFDKSLNRRSQRLFPQEDSRLGMKTAYYRNH